jgi:hypothetical protein
MKKLVSILLGIAFLALPLGCFLPSEKIVVYSICGSALLIILGCTIYGLVSKETPSRLTESMLFAAAMISLAVLSPLVVLLIVCLYIALAVFVITDNAQAIYRFFMPWILSVSFLSIPIAIALSNHWWIATIICVVAISIVAAVGVQYVKVLISYWGHKKKELYVTYSMFVLSLSLGATLFMAIYNGLISLGCWWLSLIIISFGGMITTCILLIIALLVIYTIQLIKKIRKK